MTRPLALLGLGASYGSLFAIKALAAGHTVKLVCLPNEADLINADGIRVRFPVKDRAEPVEVHSHDLPGALSAAAPGAVEPQAFDLVMLAMQEPQYRAPGVRELLGAIAIARVPCLSIMNMPPPPYLARIPGIDVAACRRAYTDASVWDRFEPGLVALCSPDAQAFRPPGEPVNVLQVRLTTNFKAAPFASAAHTAMLRTLAEGIDAARFAGEDLPVKLRVRDSVFVPLAKWSMLLAGNYRCIREDSVVSIRDAVHGDVEASRAVYAWVSSVCRALGATDADLVPFDKYALAAQSLGAPSSAARAIAAGATDIERVDRLVQIVAAQHGMQSAEVDRIVALVDARLATNRQKR